ncbi:hypothetical protein QFZ23_002202 [Arthrobacter globiformis]|nr:hypothetical protein [Arthrobacter globiformis]
MKPPTDVQQALFRQIVEYTGGGASPWRCSAGSSMSSK